MPLSVVRRAGSPYLWITGTIRGRRVRESAGTDNPRLAEEARATREAELYRAALHGTRPTVNFEAAAESYIVNASNYPFDIASGNMSTETRQAGADDDVARSKGGFPVSQAWRDRKTAQVCDFLAATEIGSIAAAEAWADELMRLMLDEP